MCSGGQLVRRTLAALAVAAVVVAASSEASAAPGTVTRAPDGGGGIGLRLVDVPAAAVDDPRAQVYIVDHLAPGRVIHRRIEVSNRTDATAHIALYPAAATIEKGGFLGAAGHTPNDVSSWTSVVPAAVDLLAGERATASVTITVPSDAPPGEQYGVVWAEVRSDPATGDGVTQVSRVGIRIYLSIGPGGPPASDFTIDSLTAMRAANGQPTVLATVHNTGGRALDMSGTLELRAGPGGLSAGPFPASLGTTLAVADTERVTIALDERLPAGPWDAHITLHSGLVERSARATITFPAAGTAPSVGTTPRQTWFPAATLLGILTVALAGALLLLLRRARRRRGPLAGASLWSEPLGSTPAKT